MSDSFSSQRFPTVEETLGTNAKSLYQQKKKFLADLRTQMGTSGYVIIGILYLRDVSTIKFILRMMVHFLVSNPFDPRLQYMVQTGEEIRKEQRWVLFWSVVIVNFYSFVSHLFFSFSKVNSQGQSHGGLSLQFVGERLPKGKPELLAFDGILFILQFLYFSLMCITDDSVVLSSSSVSESSDATVQSDMVSNGYDGKVGLISVDVCSSVKTSYRNQRRRVFDSDDLQTFRSRVLRRMNV